VVSTTGRLPAMVKTKTYPFANGMQAANGAPFADHDQELLALTPNNYEPYTDNTASEISLATGRSTSFGTADTIAGDPQARGMFAPAEGACRILRRPLNGRTTSWPASRRISTFRGPFPAHRASTVTGLPRSR
jgi:hypothetical protein